jgi:hypothetical protein
MAVDRQREPEADWGFRRSLTRRLGQIRSHTSCASPFPSWRQADLQRIFNTLTQSEKCDPQGDYIRYWVPELKNLKGKAIHDPFHNMPRNEFKKLGYPEPIVDHKQSRERALFRYKNVGEKEP